MSLSEPFKLSIDSRLYRRFLIWFSITVTYVGLFLTTQTFRFWRSGNVNEQSLCVVGISLASLYIFAYVPLALRPHLTAQIFSSHFKYIIQLKERWMLDDKKKEADKFNLIYSSAVFPTAVLLYMFPIFLPLHMILLPHSGVYLSSILPQQYVNHPLVLSLLAPFYTWLYYFNHAFLIIHIQFLIAITISYFPMTNELRLNRKSYRYIDEIRSIESFPAVYNGLYLAAHLGSEMYGPSIIPYQMAAGNMTIFMVYNLMYNYSRMSLSVKFMYILGGPAVLGYEIFILEACGRLFLESKKILKGWKPSWGTVEQARYIRRLKKSFRPIKIEFPGYAKITNLTLLKFLKGVVRGIFRAVLTLK